MPRRRSTLVRNLLCACIGSTLLAIAPNAGADRESIPLDLQPDLDRDPISAVPRDVLGNVQNGVNIDFANKTVLGSNFAVAYNAAAQHVYTGNKRVLSIYNAIDPENLALVGRIEIPTSTFSGIILSIDYPGSGNYLFVSVQSDGLYSIDISDPTQPTIADLFTGFGSGRMDVDGTIAYVATQPRDVVLVDVSDPTNMSFLGEYTQTEGLTGPIYAHNGYAYVVAQNGLLDPLGFWIIDATDPANPTKVNELFLFSNVTGIAGDGNRLYVTSSDLGLHVFSLSTPALPSFLGFGSGGVGEGNSVAPDGNRAYVVTGPGLDVIDVTDPANMSVLGSTTDIPSYGNAFVVATGAPGYAYVGAGVGGTQIADVSTPAAPTIVGSVPSPGAFGLSVSGSTAYYIGRGILAVDISIVDRPQLLSFDESADGATALHATGNRLYYADSDFHVVDVTDPSNPTELGTLAGISGVTAIDSAGSSIYLARGSTGFTIVDVTDPAQPVSVSTTPVTDEAKDVRVLGGIAYVANGDDGLALFDVLDPAAPQPLGTLDTTGDATGVDVAGDYAYVADESSGAMLIIDISDSSDPILTGQYLAPAFGNPLDVVVVGDLAYVAARTDGLRVVDVTLPFAPVEAASYETDDLFTAVDFQGGYALTVEGSGGASILHYVGECFDDFEPNDDFAGAFPITDGTIYSPKICDQNDIDYFSIVPEPGDTLEITMQPPPSKDYNLFLYDSGQSLVDASVTSGDATENITHTVFDTGPYYVEVIGNAGQFDSTLFYTLFYFAQPCVAPTQEPYIYTSDVDGNFNTVLFIQDPNQPATVTGYNLYRSDSPIGPFDLIGENLTDFDQGEPNVQLVDVDSGSCGPLCFYEVTAVNGTCGAEGPGAPDPLDPCPGVVPCNGESCVQTGAPLSSVDTGLDVCLTDQGSALGCTGGQTVQVVTYDCTDGACCFEQPACACFIGNCPDGTYLECK